MNLLPFLLYYLSYNYVEGQFTRGFPKCSELCPYGARSSEGAQLTNSIAVSSSMNH